MTVKTRIGAAALALTLAAPAFAVPIDLDFEFGNISGTLFGLDNADGLSAATGLQLTGEFDTYNVSSTQSAQFNSFLFGGGELQNVDFL